MENLTPKIDDALGAVIESLKIEGSADEIQTLKRAIIQTLREYGVVLSEENL